MKETSFKKYLRNKLSFAVETYPIESHASCPGVPDLSYLIKNSPGIGGWIETKSVLLEPSKIAYRPHQAWWLDSHWKLGGRAWTFLRVCSPIEILYVIPGDLSLKAERNFQDIKPMCWSFYLKKMESRHWQQLVDVLSASR